MRNRGILHKNNKEIARTCALFVIYALITMSMFFFNHRKFDHNVGSTMICGSFAVILLTFLLIKPNAGHIEWNRVVLIPLVFFGIGTLIIGRIHPLGDGYIVLAVDMMIVFPIYYYAWNTLKDNRRLYTLIALAIELSALISFLICLNLSFKGSIPVSMDGDFMGHTKNPNVLGMLGVVILIASIYLIFELSHITGALIMASIGVGISVGYIRLSIARAAMLYAVTCIIVLIIFSIKTRTLKWREWNKRKASVLRKISIVLMASIIALMGTLQLDDINYRAFVKKTDEGNPVGNIKSIDNTDIKISALNEWQLDQILSSQASVTSVQSTTKAIKEKQIDEEKWNTLSGGRLVLWKTYLSNTTLTGNSMDHIKNQFPKGTEIRAHNNIIDYCYRCGIIVGGLYTIYFIATGICGLIILFSKKYRDPMHLFVVMMIGTYSIYAMVEISTMPFCRVVPCFYFLTMAPIVGKLKNFQSENSIGLK